MLFTAYLMPDDVLARRPDYHSAIAAVVRANNGTMGKGGIVRLPDGSVVRVDDHNFRLDALSPTICRVIFDTAVRTNTYVETEGSVVSPLVVQGTKLKIDRDLGPATLVANPNVLCAKLQERLTRWSKDNARMVADGIMGPDGQLLMPPPNPAAERRISIDTSGIAAKC